MEIQRSAQGDAWCPKCNAALLFESQRCGECGYTLTNVRLYDPKHFIWLALLFSAMVPIYLAASNWGKIGRTRAKRLWLGFGFLGLVILITVGSVLPDAGHISKKLAAYLVNFPLAYLLRDQQRHVYAAALRLGARPASLVKGSMAGLLLVLCALVVPIAGPVAVYQIEFHRGVALAHQGEYRQAAAIFEHILQRDMDDQEALFNLALCHAAMERWDEAAEGIEKYLRRNDDDPVAWAFMASVRFQQGRHTEAAALTSKASALDPKIMEKLFGSDDASSGEAQGEGKQEP